MLTSFVYPLLSLVSLLMAGSALRLGVALRRFKIRSAPAEHRTDDLPTVSVCIPVRNEMRLMTDCLERVLASDYRKLEVIVYDDSSSDETSVLVRSFAHEGVRFVPARELPAGWLGKNRALSILSEEASGELLLFLDVDTVIEPTTIGQLVQYVSGRQLDMVAVLPLRRDSLTAGTVFCYLRYFWELIIAGREMPATSSALWVIRRLVLQVECGGFGPLALQVRPEQQLAERLGTHRYHCLLGSRQLGVSEQKSWTAQRESARRLFYPIVGGRPLAGVSALLILLLFNLPLLGCIVGLVGDLKGVLLWSSILLIGGIGMYSLYTYPLRSRAWWLDAIVFPLLLVQEVYFLSLSLVAYATRTVTWKGRPMTARPRRPDYVVIDK